MPTITTGPNNDVALQFNGTTDRIDVGQVTTGAKVTMTALVNTTNATGQAPIFSNRGNGTYFGIVGGLVFIFDNTGSPNGIVSTKKISDGKWHHIAWTNDGTTSKIYIDGVLDTTTSQTRTGQTGPGYIGYDAGGTNNYFTGTVADVHIFNASF